jgi:hypothetical protein
MGFANHELTAARQMPSVLLGEAVKTDGLRKPAPSKHLRPEKKYLNDCRLFFGRERGEGNPCPGWTPAFK